MKKPIVFMFSGQGSQFYQMGKELFHENATFREWMTTLDNIAKDMCGESVIDAIYDPGKNMGDRFDDILFSHPAIFMIEYALYQALREDGVTPDYIVGTSMGEYAASAVSGMTDYADALEMVIRQASLYTGRLGKGGMIAILDSPDIWFNTPLLQERSEIGAFNFDSHFVISAKEENLAPIITFLKKSDIMYFQLPVDYPFHSSLINNIREDMISLYSEIDFQRPEIETFSCASGKRVTEPGSDYPWNVVRKPILFSKTVSELAAGKEPVFIDLGPSGTLATFARYLLPKERKSETLPIMTPFTNDLKKYGHIVNKFSLRNNPENSLS